MIKLFSQCPACGGPIVITECRCARCQLTLRGEFQPGSLATLSEEQLTFIRSFLRVRGNLSELEKVLGVSYPTIRNKLDEINAALERDEAGAALPVPPPTAAAEPSEDARKAVLSQVSAGKLSVNEALRQLRDLPSGGQ